MQTVQQLIDKLNKFSEREKQLPIAVELHSRDMSFEIVGIYHDDIGEIERVYIQIPD